jgi:1-acyl-sn-glycerol-3-phosphate acyltransferase
MRKLNYYWRLWITLWSFIFFGLGGLLMGITVFPIIYIAPIPIRWKIYSSRSIKRLSFKLFIAFMKYTGALTYEIHGAEKFSSRNNLLIIANHPTLIDVVFILSFANRPNCVVKKGVWKNPFMYFVVKASGFICNSGKAEEMIHRCVDALKKGDGLIIFPEGTRTKANGEIHFKRGVAHIALEANKVFTPVIITCNPITLTKQHRWYHIPKNSPPHFIITVKDDRNFLEKVDETDSQAVKARKVTKNMQTYFIERVNNA